MGRVDIAIIGNGPGGVSAALTAKARNQEILLFGSAKASEKVSKAHAVRNYPGLPDIAGEDFANAFANHLKVMGIELTQEQVTNIYAMGNYYAIQTPNNMYEATSVILATGMAQGKSIAGEEEYLGKGVSYCATCDAFFYKDKPVAVLGYNDEAKAEAEFLATTSSHVYYIPMVKGDVTFTAENVTVLKERPQEILGADGKTVGLQTEQSKLDVDGVFILRDAVSPATLVPGLKVENEHVVVNLQMETNLPGCFACGDIVGRPYQYIKAAGQGNVAALSAVEYNRLKKQA